MHTPRNDWLKETVFVKCQCGLKATSLGGVVISGINVLPFETLLWTCGNYSCPEILSAHTALQVSAYQGVAAAAAKSLQLCPTLCDPIDGSPHRWQTPPSLGFSRQEHWGGLPFPSPMHESEKSK